MDVDPTSTGRERAVDALVRSATELFAARGPSAVSLREIAAHAGVNFGLIHQYIGTKDNLLRLAFQRASEHAADRFGQASDLPTAFDMLMRADAAPSPYVRMLAWALLEGRDPADLLGRSPALSTLRERFPLSPGGAVDENDPRVRIAAFTCLALGWSLFSGFVRSAADIDEASDDDVASAIRGLARRLLDAPST